MLLIVGLVLALALLGSVLFGIVTADRGAAPVSDPSDSANPSATDTAGPSVSDSASPSADAAQARRAPEPALQQFYDQQLSWSDCRDGSSCASLTVPLDYTKPRGQTIEIAVLRRAAAGERLGSLVVNPGGPGASGMDYAEGASRVFGDRLRDSFDIVGFDPRGVGESTAIDCLSDTELDAYVAQDPTPDDATEAAAWVAGSRRTAQGCRALSGALTAHVTTEEAARDLDVLRAALEEPELAYFGASYGTQLGATYAHLFPERVGRLVLDGAVDVSLDAAEMARQQAAGFEIALRAYVGYCVESSDSCFLGDTVDAGLARIRGFLEETESEPLSTDLGDRRLEAGNALYGVITPLYDRAAWSALSLALRQAFDGDGTMLLQFSDLYVGRDSDGTYPSNIIEANLAINCADARDRPTLAEVEASLGSFAQSSPTFGRALGWSQLACAGFPANTRFDPSTIRAAGAPPIVVVGTTRDPATPLAWAEALAEQLESGVLVTRDGDGHTGYHSGNQCVDDAVEDYLTDGVVPSDGLRC